MRSDANALFLEMIAYEAGCPQRIQHLSKVRAFAMLIGETEGLPAETLNILEAAALTHDIGIKRCEEKYHSASGHLQELEGPPIAAALLARLGYEEPLIGRVCHLIARHHTYDPIDGLDHQILVEADFLVNLFEGDASAEAVLHAYESIFRTATGGRICRAMFGINATNRPDASV